MTELVKVADRMGWHGRVEARHYRHPEAMRSCSRCLAAPQYWCGLLEHRPIPTAVLASDNIITNVGLNMFRDVLDQGVTDGEIKYMGWGSSNTTPAVTDTVLGTEDDRKIVTAQADGGNGIQITTVYLSPDDANQTLEELGWFATPSATASVDTGLMIARVLYPGGPFTKDNLESIQLQRTDTIT